MKGVGIALLAIGGVVGAFLLSSALDSGAKGHGVFEEADRRYKKAGRGARGLTAVEDYLGKARTNQWRRSRGI